MQLEKPKNKTVPENLSLALFLFTNAVEAVVIQNMMLFRKDSTLSYSGL